MSIEEQIKCAERELAIRYKVYPYRVRNGKMNENTAKHETQAMEAIVKTLRSLLSEVPS